MLRLITGLQAISKQLSSISDVASVWHVTLTEVGRRLNIDSGAWVWNSPIPLTTSLDDGARFNNDLWPELVKQLPEQNVAQCLDKALPESPFEALIIVPVVAELWSGHLILGRTSTAFSQAELDSAYAIIEMARLVVIERLQRKAYKQQSAASEIVRAVSRTTDQEAFTKELVYRIAELVNAKIAGLLLYEPQTKAMVAQLPFVGIEEALISNYVIPFDKGDDITQQWRNQFYWLIDDMQNDPRVKALGLQNLAQTTQARQAILVALETAGDCVGFIQVAHTQEGHYFTEEDAYTLVNLSSQLSGMLRASQLMTHMQHSTQHLRSLVSVASAVNTSLDLQTVLEEVVNAVSRVFDCQRTAIFVLDPVSNLLSLAASKGVSDRYRSLSQSIPVVKGGRAHAIAANEMVISVDINQEPEITAIAPFAVEEGFQAFADLPLRCGELPVGLLSVQFTEVHHFTDDELSILQILAEHAAVAIENARLYTATDVALRRRLDALAALQRVTGEITSTVDLNYILQVVLDEAMNFSQADAGLVLLYEDLRPELRTVKGYSTIFEDLKSIVESPDFDSLWNDFAEHNEPYYLVELESASEPDICNLPNAKSLLITPVFYEGQLAAVILVQSSSIRAFATAVVEFLQGLAVQTSIAVGNSKRFQEQLQRGELMHKRAEQMSLLLEVSWTIRSDRSLEAILQDIAYAVQEGTGFEIVLISVLESNYLRRVAGAGIPLKELDRMKQVRQPWDRLKALFREEFRMGHCYYIPAEYDYLTDDLDKFIPEIQEEERDATKWNKLDSFVVPLYGSGRGEILGIMSVDLPRNGLAPTPVTAEVIEIFAAQVALAIENNNLVESLRRQVTTLRLFNELNRSITTKLDLPLVLNTVVQSVTNLLDYDYATIFLQDKITKKFIPLASSGYSLDLLSLISFAVGEGLVGKVAQMGMPLVMDNTATDPSYVPGPIAVGSSIMVPLTVEGRAVGVLSADRKIPGDFSPTDVATLTALADQVSVAVENARLFDEVTRFSQELELRVEERTQELAEALEGLRVHRDRTEVLYHIASELVANLDVDRMLSQALSLLQKAVKASKSSVILLDNESGKLFYRAAIGHTKPIPAGGRLTPFSRKEGLVGWVLNEKKPVIVHDVLKDDRWIPNDLEIRSVLSAPVLSSADEAFGVILLQSPAIGVFDEPELRLVEAAAVQLGNALSNAQLYRLIREQAERLGAMLRTQQIEAAKNQAILEGIADGVMVTDANGRVILFNAAAERILAISRAQALGRFQDDILGLYGSAAQEWLARIDIWKQNPESYESDEFMAHRLEVERNIVSVHLSPVTSPAHEFLGVVSVFRDITVEVEADRAKSEFVSTVSHELRTPMTSIKGYVDLLLMGAAGEVPDAQKGFLKTVKTNADRLTDLVNDLLDISRIETGRVELNLKPLSIAALIEQVIDLLRPKVQEKEQNLYAILPENLPNIYGDEARVTQILTNLVGNAYKYTPNGGEVAIHVYVNNKAMCVAVADNGIGIAKKNQQKIFDRFYRVEDDPAVYEVSGTGLGLAITLSLIQMHGGNIFLESELGKGSVFTFTLPLAEGESTDDVGTPPVGFSKESPATILVVEDNPEIADLLKVTLTRESLNVLVALSGQDALKIAREERPDLISLDIRLPDLDGFEVLSLLRQDPKTADIPAIIVSVVADKEKGLHLGVVDYFSKPMDSQRLVEAVNRILSHRGTVVIADADEKMLSVMRSALQAQGIEVRTTSRGDRALRLARELHPELILLDLKLSNLDGYQVLEKLKRNPQTADIPVVMTTNSAVDAKGNAVTLEALGALQFLTKPFSVNEFAEEISGLITGNRTHKE